MTAGEGELDRNSEHYLRNALSGGSAILFTGAGFSRGARNIAGDPMPLGSELAADLWDIAFPGETLDPTSSLGEIYDVARQAAGTRTKELLTKTLRVDPETIPDFYKDYLFIPWFKIYSLNLDNLFPLAASRFSLPRNLTTVSATTGTPPPEDGGLRAIHLNGLVGDYPNVTFSPPQFGARTAGTDPLYDILAREMFSHPVVFIGTALDEPPLWHHVALRDQRPSTSELRPKSFLVTPTLPVARRAMLERYNMKWVAMTAEEFCEAYISPLIPDLPSPAELAPRAAANFDDVGVVRDTPTPDLPDFLLGREPQWGDVSPVGFSIERTCEKELLDQIGQGTRLAVLTGTAGAGKSTVLKRVALALHSSGREVRWLRHDAPGSVAELRGEARELGGDAAVLIDDAGRFGRRTVDLLRGIAEYGDSPVLVAAMSSTQYEELDIEPGCYGLTMLNKVVPNLDNREIDDLIESLDRANRLGRLSGMTPTQRREELRVRSKRQLLVAMLEATSGKKFEEMIANECQALPADLSLAYSVAALATVNSYPLPRDVMMACLSDYSSEGLAVVDRLTRQHLLLKLDNNCLAARHSVVAREAVAYYRSAGQLIEAVERLAFALASRVPPHDRRSKEARLLARLINHTTVHATATSRQRVRELYEQLEGLLKRDPHFWLQRGAYEVEKGDVDLADNFLRSARSLSDGDYMIETEWAYLMMRRACEAPASPQAREWVDEAHEILFDIIEERGQITPNTYVVLAHRTKEWCDRADLLLSEKIHLLQSVRGVMTAGAKWHGSNSQFSAAAHDVEKAYLELALDN